MSYGHRKSLKALVAELRAEGRIVAGQPEPKQARVKRIESLVKAAPRGDLSPVQAEAVRLYVVEGLRGNALANAMGATVTNSQAVLQRAAAKLGVGRVRNLAKAA